MPQWAKEEKSGGEDATDASWAPTPYDHHDGGDQRALAQHALLLLALRRLKR